MEIEQIADSAELATKWKAERIAETEGMRKAMEDEEGLLNIPQTAVLLDVTRARVCELMKLGTLKRFEFFGQIYLSFREVSERRKQDVKAGRPARSALGKLAAGVKAAALSDRHQMKQRGYAGPYQDRLHREAKAKRGGKK